MQFNINNYGPAKVFTRFLVQKLAESDPGVGLTANKKSKIIGNKHILFKIMDWYF